MLKPIDRSRRDGPLYPGSPRTLRDFIDPKHLLVRIDANFDFASLFEFVQAKYDPAIGRPAVCPEILLRALLLSALYNVTSYRQLCDRISENLAWRWFCHLTLEDEVFDHSTVSVFIDRLGASSFQELLSRLNTELLRLGLFSSRVYVDSSLVEANVRVQDLNPTDLTAEEFAERATEKDGVYTICQKKPASPDEGKLASLQYLRYQGSDGHLPLSPTDPDARWRKPSRGRPAILGYKDNIIVERSGFILVRDTTSANASDFVGTEPLLERLPFLPKSLCGDTGYRAGRLRQMLRRRGITPYIPLHPNQEATGNTALVTGEFVFHGDHITCKQNKVLAPVAFANSKDIVQYVALQAECQKCPIREACLSPNEKRKHVGASRYELELRWARRTNQTGAFQREMGRRKTVVEGVFARLDRLGWEKARLRGLDKVDCQATIAALAHNILKALAKARFWKEMVSVVSIGHRPTRLEVGLVLLLPLPGSLHRSATATFSNSIRLPT